MRSTFFIVIICLGLMPILAEIKQEPSALVCGVEAWKEPRTRALLYAHLTQVLAQFEHVANVLKLKLQRTRFEEREVALHYINELQLFLKVLHEQTEYRNLSVEDFAEIVKAFSAALDRILDSMGGPSTDTLKNTRVRQRCAEAPESRTPEIIIEQFVALEHDLEQVVFVLHQQIPLSKFTAFLRSCKRAARSPMTRKILVYGAAIAYWLRQQDTALVHRWSSKVPVGFGVLLRSTKYLVGSPRETVPVVTITLNTNDCYQLAYGSPYYQKRLADTLKGAAATLKKNGVAVNSAAMPSDYTFGKLGNLVDGPLFELPLKALFVNELQQDVRAFGAWLREYLMPDQVVSA